jgi:hypothetical protein
LFNAGSVNSAANYRAVIKEGIARVGGLMSENFLQNCATRCNVPAVPFGTIPDFWGITMCAHWNFMSSNTFEIKNGGGEAFQKCAYRITYQYDNAGTTETKYCFFCPVNQAGMNPADPIPYVDLQLPTDLGRNWATGTYMGVTGLRGVNGL